MSEQRLGELEAMLAVDALQSDAAGSRIGLICARLVIQLGVSGAGATILSHTDGDGARGARSGPSRGLVYATDEISSRLEDLQLTVGEGPCLEAFESGGPILVTDVAVEAPGTRWPAFAAAAMGMGAVAVYSFPLQIGVVRLGSLDCYHTEPVQLAAAAVTDALVLADLASQAVLAELDGHATADTSWLVDPHTEVHQATGMASVQLGTSTETALLRLRAHAYAHDQAIGDVAKLVITRQLRFHQELPEGSP